MSWFTSHLRLLVYTKMGGLAIRLLHFHQLDGKPQHVGAYRSPAALWGACNDSFKCEYRFCRHRHNELNSFWLRISMDRSVPTIAVIVIDSFNVYTICGDHIVTTSNHPIQSSPYPDPRHFDGPEPDLIIPAENQSNPSKH